MFDTTRGITHYDDTDCVGSIGRNETSRRMVMEARKEWYKSRTIWINIISLVIMVITTMAGWTEFQVYAPEMLAVVNTLNIIIRFLTSEGIK